MQARRNRWKQMDIWQANRFFGLQWVATNSGNEKDNEGDFQELLGEYDLEDGEAFHLDVATSIWSTAQQ